MYDETEAVRLAAQQHGLATRAQLLELGFTRGMLNQRFRSGRWTPIGRSVVALGPTPRRLPGRTMAVLLAVPQAVASHRTAALLHDLPGLAITRADTRKREADPVEVSTIARSSVRAGEVIVHERTTRPRSLFLHGLRVTTVPQTLADLGGVVDQHLLDRVVDMTLAQNQCSLEALERHLAETPAQGGAGPGGAAADRDGPAPARRVDERDGTPVLGTHPPRRCGVARPAGTDAVGRHRRPAVGRPQADRRAGRAFVA